MRMYDTYLKQICANCGLTFGAHYAGTSKFPINTCPGHEGRMDFDKGPGTAFKGSNKFEIIETGTPARTIKCPVCNGNWKGYLSDKECRANCVADGSYEICPNCVEGYVSYNEDDWKENR